MTESGMGDIKSGVNERGWFPEEKNGVTQRRYHVHWHNTCATEDYNNNSLFEFENNQERHT